MFPPVRSVDTRAISNPSSTLVRLGLASSGITAPPADVEGVILNVKLFNPSGRALIAVFPCDKPDRISSGDAPQGAIGQITVIAPVSAQGEVCIEARNSRHQGITADRLVVYTTGWMSNSDIRVNQPPTLLSEKS